MSSLATDFWRARADGVRVAVRVQPGARRTGLLGRMPDIAGTRLKIAVAAPAEGGRANRAACAALAAALGVPAGSIDVIQGACSRQKTLIVAGDAAVLGAKLAAL